MLILLVLGWSRQCPSENRRQVVLVVSEARVRCSETLDSLANREARRVGGTNQGQKEPLPQEREIPHFC